MQQNTPVRTLTHPYATLGMGFLAAWVVNTLMHAVGDFAVNYVCLGLGACWLVASLWLMAKEGSRGVTAAILLGGFLAGLCFALKMPHNFSWHDLAAYDAHFTQGAANPDGHLGYIAWMVEHTALPLGLDPMQEGFSVFYNPPLYHIIAAAFMKLNLWLSVPQAVALENLQLINWAFACACAIAVVEVLRFFRVAERGVRVAAIVAAWTPFLWIMGATPNNDMLSILCIVVCLCAALRWLNLHRTRDMLCIALSLGAGMAAKLSAAVLIPVLAVVFAGAFFTDLPHWKRYVGQYALFLLISVPLACAWPVYHLLAYQVPLTYVRLPAETINVGHLSLWQRFGLPDGGAVRELFYTGIRKTDHNVWMQTLKTAAFDELTLFEKGTHMWYVAYAYMAALLGLLVLSAVAFWRMVLRRNGLNLWCRVLLGGYALLLLGNYIKFCVDYPYICTFNFRYILPLLFLGAIGLADMRAVKKWTGAWMTAYAVGFALVSAGVYIAYFVT